MATGSLSAALHRSSLPTFSGHRTQKILHTQPLTEVWSLWSIDWAILHVSDPERGTYFTCVENPQLGGFPTSLEFQTFLRIRKAVRAVPILALTSASAQPCASTMLPKQRNSSRGCPAVETGLLLSGCILRIFVLPLLMWRPILADIESRQVVLSCIHAWL